VVRPERFELPTPCFVGNVSRANSLILQHGWQPTGTFRHAGNIEVVPNWYSIFDHLLKVLSVYLQPCSITQSSSRQIDQKGTTNVVELLKLQSGPSPERGTLVRVLEGRQHLWDMTLSDGQVMHDYLEAERR
jgi:hypothetical protein